MSWQVWRGWAGLGTYELRIGQRPLKPDTKGSWTGVEGRVEGVGELRRQDACAERLG